MGRATNFTVRISAPEEAKANENGTVFIRVQSTTDASVWDGKKLLAIINPTFRLELETLVPNKWVDPGKSVDFMISVRNVGNMQGKVTIFVTSSEPRQGWKAVLDRETVFLAGGEQQVVRLTTTAPQNALAGSRQVIEVHAVSEDFSSRGDVQVSALVNRVYGLSYSIDPPEISIQAGEKAKYLVTVTNDGNGNENVALASAMVPPGWFVTFEVDDVEVRNVVLLSKETKTFTGIVDTPYDALAGRSNLMVVLLDEAGTEYDIDLTTKITQYFGVDLSSSKYRGEGAPKGIVNYRLTIKNEGNGEDTFTLQTGNLPSDRWTSGFYTRTAEVETLVLQPGQIEDVELRIHIPEGTSTTDPIEFFARATSTGAETDDVKLVMEVKLPDLKIQSVEYNPTRIEALEPIQITVRIRNDGTFAAERIIVVLKEGTKEIGRERIETITKDSNATASFTWVPTAGKKTLTYEVSNDIPETTLDNNVLIHTKKVSEEDVIPGFAGVIVLLAMLAVALVGMYRRFR